MSEPALDKVRRLVGADRGLCTIACLDREGSPHLSVVNAGVLEHPITGVLSAALVVRATARKVRLLRADPRAAISFRDGPDWVAVHGSASLVGLDDPTDGFDPAALPDLLRQVYRAAGGTHDDWDTFDRVMAEERRLAVFVSIDRVAANTGSLS